MNDEKNKLLGHGLKRRLLSTHWEGKPREKAMPRILFLFCVTFKKDQGSEGLLPETSLAFFFATLTRWIRPCEGSFKFLDWEVIQVLQIGNMGIFN